MNQATINPKKTAIILITIMVLLGLLNVVSFIPMIRGTRDVPINMINLDAEQSFSALFSTTILWLCAIFTTFISLGGRGRHSSALKWGGLAAAFFFLGLDESLGFHERVSLVVLPNSLGWTLPYAILVIVFGIVYFRFLLEIPKETRRLILVGGSVYVLGSIGVEIFSQSLRIGGVGFGYHATAALEEMMEMAGIIVLAYAFASYIDRHLPAFKLRVSSQAAKPTPE